MISLNRKNRTMKIRISKIFKISIILLLLFQSYCFVISVNASSPINYQIYTINIGDTTSEINHILYGWGPIEPDTHNGHWGNNDDGSFRVAWYNDTTNPSDIPTSAPDQRWATLNISITEGFTAYRIYLRALDGLSNDSFEVYINNEIVLTYISQEVNKTWKTHNRNLLPLELKGNLEIKIKSIGNKSSDFDTIGQLAISWIKIYAREDKFTTVRLTTSQGNPITNAHVQYNCGGWKEIGYTNSNGNISRYIPTGTYTFKITYRNSSITKRQNINENQTVLFNTSNVTVKFQNSNSIGISNGTVKINAGGWKDFGITNDSGIINDEILPRKYSFKVIWDNASITKSQDIRTNPVVILNTTKVKILLKNSNQIPLSGANVSYYSGFWKPFGITNTSGIVTKELLPKKYKFKIIYDNATVYKTQDITTNPIVNFSTINVTIKLKDSNQNPLSDGNVSYNANGWKFIGTTNSNGTVNKELLPKKYKFKMDYDRSVIYKTQDISLDSLVNFSTVNVTIVFKNSSDVPINNSKIQYYSAGWKDLGITNESGFVNSELIPKKYSFKVIWDNASYTKKQDIDIDPIVIFSTIQVTVKLLNETNEGIPGGIVSYYSTRWKDLGFTNIIGETKNELLPKKYTFRMNYNGSRVNINQNLAEDPIIVFNTTYLYNKRPIAKTNGPYFNFTNETILLNGSKSYDSDGVIVNYTWNLGDGTIKYEPIINYTYSKEGLYVIRLTVKDDIGAVRTSRTYGNITYKPDNNNSENNNTQDEPQNNPTVNPPNNYPSQNTFLQQETITNEIPIAKADGPYEGYVNIEIFFNGSQSKDDGTIQNYTWNFGDGTLGYGKTITHKYEKTGIYEIILEITDDNGASDIFITTVDIRDLPNNVPNEPIINHINNKNNYVFNITAFDIDGDLIRFIIDWGDNTSETTEFISNNTNITIYHQWEKPGNYTIKIRTDDNKTLSKTKEISLSIFAEKSKNEKLENQSDEKLFFLLIFMFILLIIISFLIKIIKQSEKKEKKIKKIKQVKVKKTRPKHIPKIKKN